MRKNSMQRPVRIQKSPGRWISGLLACSLAALSLSAQEPDATADIARVFTVKDLLHQAETYWAETVLFEGVLKKLPLDEAKINERTYLRLSLEESSKVYALPALKDRLQKLRAGTRVTCRGTVLHTGRTFFTRSNTYGLLIRDIIKAEPAVGDATVSVTSDPEPAAADVLRETIIQALNTESSDRGLTPLEFLEQQPDQAERLFQKHLETLLEAEADGLKILFAEWIRDDLTRQFQTLQSSTAAGTGPLSVPHTPVSPARPKGNDEQENLHPETQKVLRGL